jgi:hypothetical protein
MMIPRTGFAEAAGLAVMVVKDVVVSEVRMGEAAGTSAMVATVTASFALTVLVTII